MSHSAEQFTEDYDFVAVCLAAIERRDYQAALSSLKRGLTRNLRAGEHGAPGECAGHMLTLAAALESSLRKVYGHGWEQSVGTPEVSGEKRGPRCSFCGRPEGAVGKVIVGGACGICKECVGVCVEILKDAGQSRPADGSS